MIETSESMGYRQVVAIIGDGGNNPSVDLHVACGFSYVGTLEDVGWKFGRSVNTVIMQRALGTKDSTGGPVPPDRWDRARHDLEAALAGDLDPASKLAARAAAYAAEATPGHAIRVEAAVDPASQDTVVTIHCTDRIGPLAEILGALYRSGLEIRLAKLDSRGGEVVDTFNVRKQGAPIHDTEVLSSLEEEISQWIEP